jgi:hypothetical protein
MAGWRTLRIFDDLVGGLVEQEILLKFSGFLMKISLINR